MADLSRDLLQRPVEETARFLALDYLDEAAGAWKRLEDPQDTEALHDFRVGLRRLRSAIRAYRPVLKSSVSKTLRKQLKDMATSTNMARDTEVQIAWLRQQEGHLTEDQRLGFDRLLRNIESRQSEELATSLPNATRNFEGLRQKLARRLSTCEFRLDNRSHRTRPSFLTMTGELIRRHLVALQEDLGAVHSVEDIDALHQSRISAKRLRYLLEPLRKEMAEAKSAVQELKSFQDTLGELHDLQVLAQEVSRALERSAVEQARRLQEATLHNAAAHWTAPAPEWTERYGLLELLRILKEREAELFARFEKQALGEAGIALFQGVEELGQRLASSPSGITSHRRYLLTRVPERARAAPSSWVEEGWVAGKAVPEVLRRVRSRGRVAHYRTLLPGSQGYRWRLEERIPRKLFETLWPLTERRRLGKRCYEIVDQNQRWVVQELPDQGLVIAEAEIIAEESKFRLPEWIAECLRREVTGIKRYEAASLAAASPGEAESHAVGE